MTRLHRASRRGLRDRRGTEVLELALLLAPLLMLTFGAIDFGYYYLLQHNLEGAAREGVRTGITYYATSADVQASVDRFMVGAGFKTGTYTVKMTDVASAQAGDAVAVKITMPYTAIGIPPARVPKTTVAAEAVMTKEGSPSSAPPTAPPPPGPPPPL